jgi:Tol biopolymer transport system component
MNADGSRQRRLTHDPANEAWFSWSPDGQELAFVRNWQVNVIDVDGGGERRPTQGGT